MKTDRAPESASAVVNLTAEAAEAGKRIMDFVLAERMRVSWQTFRFRLPHTAVQEMPSGMRSKTTIDDSACVAISRPLGRWREGPQVHLCWLAAKLQRPVGDGSYLMHECLFDATDAAVTEAKGA